MRLLVCGGAGFIGSNFISYILKRYPEYFIINYDALTYAGNVRNLEFVQDHPNYQFIHGDITDEDSVKAVFRNGVDMVINFAAESHVDRSIRNAHVFVHTNVLGTQTLLEVARQYGVKKYVQISTDEVYGSLGETGLFTEETNLAANSPYSASKAGADLLVRAYHETYDLPVNILRCSNNYGPNQHPEKFIPTLITRALANQSVPIYGDGLYVRDWLYVDDHCKAIDLVIHHGYNGEIYNVGGNNERTNLQIAQFILNYLNKPDSIIEFVEDRLGHDRRYGIDATKIKARLGWNPTSNLEDGLIRTINWYLSNSEWWSDYE